MIPIQLNSPKIYEGCGNLFLLEPIITSPNTNPFDYDTIGPIHIKIRYVITKLDNILYRMDSTIISEGDYQGFSSSTIMYTEGCNQLRGENFGGFANNTIKFLSSNKILAKVSFTLPNGQLIGGIPLPRFGAWVVAKIVNQPPP